MCNRLLIFAAVFSVMTRYVWMTSSLRIVVRSLTMMRTSMSRSPKSGRSSRAVLPKRMAALRNSPSSLCICSENFLARSKSVLGYLGRFGCAAVGILKCILVMG